MKQILLFFCLALFTAGLSAQVVYVDADATGTADGSSWANAYTDLAEAIDSAAAGSKLWIAEGRYVTPDSSSFFVDRELSLLGGFGGTETEAGQSDPSKFQTVLSGDVMGNDPTGTFDSTLMADNQRVLTVIDTNETSMFTVTIDGLTIRDGIIAADFPGGGLIPFAGGGIYSEARLAVSRVTFTANRADFGSATCLLFSTTGGSTFDRVTTSGNYTQFRSNHYVRLTDSVAFKNSTFVGDGDSAMNSGMLYAQNVFNLIVEDCTFDSINAPSYRGAAIRTADVLGQQILGTDFTNLSADLGGALYFRNDTSFIAERQVTAAECIIDSCSFTNIYGDRWGGTIFFGNISHAIVNSTFEDGIGAVNGGLGGAVYAQNTDALEYQYRVLNSQFLGNQSNGSGGAIFYFSDNIDVGVGNSEFDGNFSGNNGGAIQFNGSAGFDNVAQISNTVFNENEHSQDGFGGAAILTVTQNTIIDNSQFTGHRGRNGTVYVGGVANQFLINNCLFADNGDAGSPTFPRGAAIWAGLNAGDAPDVVLVDSCDFINNVITSDEFISGGSAIYLSGDAGSAPIFDIRNSTFANNSATDGTDGTVLLLNGVDVTVDDCDFLFNSARSGGAISTLRTSEPDTIDGVPFRFYRTDDVPVLAVKRTLFANNNAENQGGAIDLTSSSIDMENSILVGNTVTIGSGSGGAIIINGSSILGAELDNTMVNNTFFGNLDGGREGDEMSPPSVGNNIAIFQPGGTNPDTNSVKLTIQNNAFFQDGIEEESLGLELNVGDVNDPTGFGDIEIVSLGGNYFNSNLAADLTITDVTMDVVDIITDVTNIFVDPLQDDPDSDFPNVELTGDAATNPLIDAGTTGPLVPERDFANNLRDDMPDIGALEFNSTLTDVAEPIENSGLAMEFFPNPTVDMINITNNDAAVTSFTVLVADMQGRLLAARQFSSTNNQLDLSTLPNGVYNLQLLIEGKVYSKQVVKQ